MLTEPNSFDNDDNTVTDDMVRDFKYRIKPTDTHWRLLECIKDYYEHNEKFMVKGFYHPGTRARKELLEIYHLVRQRRKEIQEEVRRIRTHYNEINHKDKTK
jgi:hypothetical protein